MRWEYSTTDGWKPLGGDGRPHRGEALSAGGAWHLDAGNYMAPDERGFGAWGCREANRIAWWEMASGFPADFATVTRAGDAIPRHYLRAVVTREFTVAPILNQVYERADLAESIARKYGPGDAYSNWARAITQRLTSWGFNATGQYSGRYVVVSGGLADRLPVEPTWALGGWVTRKDRPYRAKNVYAGAVFPPGSGTLIYQGLQPDVFDPRFEAGYKEMVRRETIPGGRWAWALIPEEADYLFGINSLTHDHMGYVVLSQNPYHPRAKCQDQDIEYDDPRLYAKYAMRDFLRDRYGVPSGGESAALWNLNAAWGTSYTTWDTSAGDLVRGDNAWGKGTGFMDEDGRAVLGADPRSIGFDKAFTKPSHPAIRKDLDEFVRIFASRYGRILAEAFAQVPHPVLLLPVYDGPGFVYEALAPHVDGFWVSVADPKDALRIYNAGHKPLIVADYLTADPDSPLYFKARIDAIRYDRAADTTILEASGLRYVFRMPEFVCFPDCPAIADRYARFGKPLPMPRVKSAHWDVLGLAGDYTEVLEPGMHVELAKYGNHPYARRTQAERARDMIRLYEEILTLRGDDGLGFVLGIEHWCLYDPAPSNWVDDQDFGLATFQDNAYDGVEARRATGIDARGYPVGGEDADYGDLLGPLGAFLRRIDER